jgi:hypothetical protein
MIIAIDKRFDPLIYDFSFPYTNYEKEQNYYGKSRETFVS